MAKTVDQIFGDAMHLSDDDRRALTERLTETVDLPTAADTWTEELASRVAEIDAGTAELHDGDAVFVEARAAIQRVRNGR